MPVYKIADLHIGINPKTQHTKFRLKDYICDDGIYPDFTVKITSQMLDYEAETVGNYTDISGHWAEQTIERFTRIGYGPVGDLFRPNDYITGEDFVV